MASLFFFKYWPIVREGMFKLCKDFYNGDTNLECVNWASIALMSKVDTLATLTDCHMISLINTFLKIISKVLAST